VDTMWYVTATFGGRTKQVGRYSNFAEADLYACQIGEIFSSGFTPEDVHIRVHTPANQQWIEYNWYNGKVSKTSNYTEYLKSQKGVRN
jgi:hypothetical protein